MSRARGQYLVVEGPDGCGKSTLVPRLVASLARHGVRAVETREPGGTPAGAAIRAILKDVGMQVQLPPLARRILFEADRLAHQDLIRGFVEVGTWVVSDRCAAVSNHCYAEAEGTAREFLDRITALDPHRIHPDLVLLVSTPDAAADIRLKRGQGALDPAERDPRILRSVRGAYGRLFDAARLQHSIEVIGGFRMPARVVSGNGLPGDVADHATRIVVDAFPALGQKAAQ